MNTMVFQPSLVMEILLTELLKCSSKSMPRTGICTLEGCGVANNHSTEVASQWGVSDALKQLLSLADASDLLTRPETGGTRPKREIS